MSRHNYCIVAGFRADLLQKFMFQEAEPGVHRFRISCFESGVDGQLRVECHVSGRKVC